MPDPVPYQAYKSKRHSHTLSGSNISLPLRPSNVPRSPSPPLRVRYTVLDMEKEKDPGQTPPFLSVRPAETSNSPPSQPVITVEPECEPMRPPPVPQNSSPPPTTTAQQNLMQSKIGYESSTPMITATSFSPLASSSSSELPHFSHKDQHVLLPQPSRKTSTFRRVPLHNSRQLLPLLGTPSHTHTSSVTPSGGKHLTSILPSSSRHVPNPQGRHLSMASTVSLPATSATATSFSESESPTVEHLTLVGIAPESATQTTGPTSSVAPLILAGSSNTTINRPSATLNSQPPYHPGFQPRGVARSRTEKFIVLRQVKQDGEDRGKSGMKRVERAKLERRLEKLIKLHFPSENVNDTRTERSRAEVGVIGRSDGRRVSSFFDFDIRNMSIPDAGELLRGVLGTGEANGDIRAAEQRITPWQDDMSVSKCPLCAATFHPLTTRKHHCRLCGQIVCSLPPKRPQRLDTCSLLFVVDPKTRMIDEVGERVDYGVKRRMEGNYGGRGVAPQIGSNKNVTEDENALKGVRICRSCRPILLRQQHLQEINHVPIFTELYERFLRLELEIEESLPHFQELIVALSHEDKPIKDVSATRKRLLQAFAQYDELAKRMRQLPSPNGPGSSQDRVQMAVMARASLFLQKNMFPLQSLPKSKRSVAAGSSNTNANDVNTNHIIDSNHRRALDLQPLLEQEALLESFVEEAEVRRKFEDVKTLKANLGEIRAEIQKIVVRGEDGV